MDYRRQKLSWNGWGLADHDYDLHGREAALWRFLQDSLGLSELVETPAVPLDDMPLPPSRLDAGQLAALEACLAPERVCVDRYERLFHALGKSFHDLVRLRAGLVPAAPDAVLYPDNVDELLALVELAASERLALVPFGGGSSVVGGVEACGASEHAAVLTVDMSRMNRLLTLDEESRTARAQAGIYGPQLEEALQARGFTLGHYPQSFEFSTLGGWIAARGSGQQSNRYGNAAKFLVAAQLVSPRGQLETLPFPSSAAGPDLKHLLAGSEGTLGFITEATVRLHPVPDTRDYRGFLFADFATGAAAVRQIVQEHIDVAMMRLSDADETWFLGQFQSMGKPETWLRKATSAALELAGVGERPCLLLVGMEGSAGMVSAARVNVARVAMGLGGVPLGARPGAGWYATRFEMPYLRDALLDRGVGVDTVETATSWAKVRHLRQAVREAITLAIKRHSDRGDGEPIVMAHISHSYPDGASLYFTFLFPIKLSDPVGQWLAIKAEVSDAIARNGGTISHHHGVGLDHRAWLEREKGPLGVELLRGVKRTLDPQDLMNPGKLLPDP